MGSVGNHPSKAGLGHSVPDTEAGGGWAQQFPCWGGGWITLGHPLGCFAGHSTAQTSGVLGALRENLVRGGNRLALLSAGSSQGSALECQSLGLLREMSPQQRCAPPFLQPGTTPTLLLLAPQAGWGYRPPWVEVMACLALLGAPLLCLCSRCPSLVSPCWSPVPKAAVGGPLLVVAAPQKGFPLGRVSLLSPSHCGGLCPLL